MRIVFIGTVKFSQILLEHLIVSAARVVGVCTTATSAMNADHVDLSAICEQNDIPCRQVQDVNAPDALQWIRGLRPDVIFCFGWSRLLKAELLSLAPYGVVGYHPSELPANRGRHPLIWALALGLKRTASTFFFMDEGADTGDILSQCAVEIDDDDDASSLYQKMTDVALRQVDEFIPLLAERKHRRLVQDDATANSWRKRTRADGIIDWRMSARAIHNLVRGLTRPYVGAEFVRADAVIKVWKTAIVTVGDHNLEPGKVLATGIEGAVIKCGDQAIRLVETEPSPNLRPGDYL